MNVEVTHPEFSLAAPGQSRNQKAVWMQRRAAIDIPGHEAADLVRALKFKHTANKFVTEFFRIGTQHYRIAEYRPAHGEDPRAGSAEDMASAALCHGAWSWFEKNVSIDIPLASDMFRMAPSLVQHLGSLPTYGELKLSKQDDGLRAAYENHMELVRAGLITIDGYLFEPCGEPVYIVKSYGHATAVDVCIDEEVPENTIGVFPLGRHGDAVEFAWSLVDHRRFSGCAAFIDDVVDCGLPLRDDHEVRAMRSAARVAAKVFEATYAGLYTGSHWASKLLDEVPLEDISIYRRLKKLSQATEISSDYPEELFEALEEAKHSPYSSQTFTSHGQFPLAEVLNLWENRPISLSGHPQSATRP
ncbi:hypothetical protein OIU34_21980 [Pararhizobium sp. BT-229]|uniref:hypothetical protein n=1 Tax=Pararhizobium sp. BT-229 TaxID=2986923 RepID=UPI0021F77FAE|nr:hypothetical protein [Pararhizobium sp. BT-229]MCV9964562.1 hypothetical protein [Pararhizobium sp. BT-229]